MARRAVVLALLVVAVVAAPAGASDLRARVAPAPPTLATLDWSPSITLTRGGKPAAARLTLSIRKGGERRSFRPTAARRGDYRVRVVFPSEGRWTWALAAGRTTLARGAIAVSLDVDFDLPYDLVQAGDGTVLFVDRGRVLARDAQSERIRVHAVVPGAAELVSLERLGDGTLFATDFPGSRVVRIDAARRVSTVARVEAPADLVADESGSTLWVASIADGVGVVRVDVATGRVEPFARPFEPHGIDHWRNGDFVVHDGRGVSRIDGRTGALSPLAAVDATKVVTAGDAIYGAEGTPSGGRILRISSAGLVTTLVGTGSLLPHRDGPGLELGILPSGLEPSADGRLLFTQVQPVPAVRRLDLRTGLVTTLALGRQ